MTCKNASIQSGNFGYVCLSFTLINIFGLELFVCEAQKRFFFFALVEAGVLCKGPECSFGTVSQGASRQ